MSDGITSRQLRLLLQFIQLAAEAAVHAAQHGGRIDWDKHAHVVDEIEETTD